MDKRSPSWSTVWISWDLLFLVKWHLPRYSSKWQRPFIGLRHFQNSSVAAAMLQETQDLMRFKQPIKMAVSVSHFSPHKNNLADVPHCYKSRQSYLRVLENCQSHLWWTESIPTLANCQFEMVTATGNTILKETPITHRLLSRPTSKTLWCSISSI